MFWKKFLVPKNFLALDFSQNPVSNFSGYWGRLNVAKKMLPGQMSLTLTVVYCWRGVFSKSDKQQLRYCWYRVPGGCGGDGGWQG